MPQLKAIYQGEVGATAAAVYTASFPTRITQITAVNTDSSARTLKLWHGGSDDENVIFPATSLDASGGRAEHSGGILLEKGGVLYAQASAASAVTLTIFGEVWTEGQANVGGALGGSWAVFDTSGRAKAVQAIAELADIGDVVITSVADNEVIAYDSTSGTWINQTPGEAGLFQWFGVSDADVDNPPTDAQIDTVFGEPGTVGAGAGRIDDGGAGTNVYLVISDGTTWFQMSLTAAA